MAIRDSNIIIFSSIDWSVHWQLHHQLTTSFISSGNRVLFIENTGIRSANISDISRIRERIVNWRKGEHGFSSIDGDKLTLFSPMLLPFPYSNISLFINKRIFNISISRWMRASKFESPIVISFLPTPLIQSAIKSIDPVLSIYYCANNMAESSKSASHIRPYEDYFFKSVDMVFTAAYVIQEYAKRFSDKVFYFPPGIEFDKFETVLKKNSDKGITSDIDFISGPIIGYIGALGKVLDKDLICTLANQCNNCTIVLIGPEYTNMDKLRSISNIVFLGLKPHDQLPYYIKKFSVGIVPYLCNDFTKGVYPSKLNEYLAMGIPAVSTNLREVRESKNTYGEAAVIANSIEEFVESVESLAVEENNSLLKEKRIRVAKANSWESRFEELSEIIKQELIFIKDRQLKVNWKKQFNNYFKMQSRRRKIALITILSFFIVIYSPLFWFLGEQLILKDSIKKSDAIVVFSGDGKSSYKNLSYQRRSLDAVRVYKGNYADKIFLSSGREQTIADVEMIMLYLSSKGISKSSIYILNKYPKSTFQNIEMVKKSLDKENIDSILFITAPYHSLRATLIWKKNAPGINIITPDMRDPSLKNIQWFIGFDKIKVVAYEYAAIVHNWILDRI